MSNTARRCPTLFLAALFALAAPAPLRAQTVEELIARHIEARGGYEKLKAITTLKTTLTLVTPFSEIPVVVQRKRPGFHRVDQSLPGGLSAARGVNASEAWELNPKGEVRIRPSDWFAEVRDLDADFDGLLVDYKAKGHRVEYGGMEKIGGRAAHKMIVTLASGGVRHVFLDAETFLETRQKGKLTVGPGRQAEVELRFGDYREVTGVKFPFAIDDERDGPGQTYAIYVQKVEPNVEIEDAVFQKPPAMAK